MPRPTGTEILREQARALLAPHVYDYAVTGSGIEQTAEANPAAWQQVLLRPRVLRDVSTVDPATSVLGTPIAAPVAVAPVGFQRLFHPDGEVATAKGAAGSLFTLSTCATSSFEDVAAVAGPWWMQVYVMRERERTAGLVRQAVAAGARALVLTVDTPYASTKARPGVVPGDSPGDPLLPGSPVWDQAWFAPDLTPADIGWLRELSGGLPVVVKGVVRGDDARACLDAGAAAIWVSNHGGRQLDGCVPTAVALPEVAAAVGGRAEIYVDGGVRTGRDVVRALALGARAVFLGRPVVWALATGGVDGVRALLAGLHAEVWEVLAQAGCRSPAEVTADLVR
jgi:4-hydroxymandelate oxidase